MEWTQTQKIEKGVTIIPLRDESKCDRWVLQSEAEQRIEELEAQVKKLREALMDEVRDEVIERLMAALEQKDGT